MEVLDLFAGIGGLALGFRASGFHVIGVDREPVTKEIFDLNDIGSGIQRDLGAELEIHPAAIVVGGPPCRPWSSMNLQRRGRSHDDHVLLERFFAHLWEIAPRVFLMENVPPIAGDPEYRRLVREMTLRGYSVASEVLRYSNFGAATSRRRLFTVGFRDSIRSSGDEFFRRLRGQHRKAGTVRHAIEQLRTAEHGEMPDHEWSRLKTIEQYTERYRTGQYGWKKLNWDEPAPSFGSIGKTYILHPDAGEGDFPLRVLSVREVLLIMGFSETYRFPEGTGLTRRYRMAANAVSPIVSGACAHVIREMLTLEHGSSAAADDRARLGSGS